MFSRLKELTLNTNKIINSFTQSIGIINGIIAAAAGLQIEIY